jgi:hypothetical protein
LGNIRGAVFGFQYRVEGHVISQFTSFFPILEDLGYNTFLGRIIIQFDELKGGRSQERVLAMVIVIPEIENQRLGKSIDQDKLSLRPGRVVSI